MKLHPKLREILNTHGEIKSYEYNMPLFITGCMRSGTTLLHNSLSNHPQLLKIGFELNKAWNDIGGAPILKECLYRNEKDVDPEYIYHMTNYFYDFIKENKTLKRQLMRVNELRKSKTGRVSYDWDNIIPVNKSPHFMNKIKYIGNIFPESKIIMINRDIFAHSASQKVHFDNAYRRKRLMKYFPDDEKNCWTDVSHKEFLKNKYPSDQLYPNNFRLIPKMWIKLNFLAINELMELGGGRFLFVKYEDLLDNKENEYRRIFDFLSLKEEYKAAEEKIIARDITHKNTTTLGDPMQKWKKQLQPEEIEAIEEVITEDVEKYNFINNAISDQQRGLLQ